MHGATLNQWRWQAISSAFREEFHETLAIERLFELLSCHCEQAFGGDLPVSDHT